MERREILMQSPSVSPNVLETGAVRLARAIRAGELTAVDAVIAYLDRVDQCNGAIRAIIAPDAAAIRREALEQAAAADAARERGDELGPLHGVPFTVKDTLAVAGYPATAGSAVLKDYMPEATAPVVARVLAAGAILLGKANCSEFAVDTHAGNLIFGDTRNPFDLGRTPGGSSGGDAAAVAAGLAAFGLGTDFGGSIRWPAHCTGLASMRPTVGLLPGTGILPYDTAAPLSPPNTASVLHRYMTPGPLARRVEDVELLVRLMAGPDGIDAACAPVPLRRSEEVDLAAISVAWCEGEGTVPVRSDVIRALSRAARLLGSTVRAVVNQRPPRLDEAAGLFIELRDAEGLPEVAEAIRRSQSQPHPVEVTVGILKYLSSIEAKLAKVSGAELLVANLRATARRDAVFAAATRFLGEHQILLLPVASATAPLIGTSVVEVDGQQVPRSQLGASCRAISILGLPSAVVPVGLGDDGMPIGIQVVGRRFHDHEVLAIAHEIERLVDFRPGPLAL
ncbi:amidase [Sinomonas terrae]|uniref:Amidase n=1 Tax=Sinomonas terrae TaxID=2908838 RepID=A0ABS9TYA3_9MICC|nr:amidase [Sinomonas terrae]MCH6469408.1 amidase [Sinomonas terrae]